MSQDKEKKLLDPNLVYIRPGQENSERNSNEIQKFKKQLPSIFSSQNGMRLVEKERKKF